MKRVLLLALVSVSAFAVPVDFTSVSVDPAYSLNGFTQTPEGLFFSRPNLSTPFPSIDFAADVVDVELTGTSTARMSFVGYIGDDFVFQRQIDPDNGAWSIALYYGTLNFDRIVVTSAEDFTVTSMDYSRTPIPGRPDVVPDAGSTALLLAGGLIGLMAARHLKS
jgi:hypothetical protein